jgi:hypothetical protein
MPPTVDCMAPSTLRAASLTAARIQILQHLDVSRLHGFGIDAQAEQLFAAVHFGGDGSASGRGFDDGLLHFFLQGLRTAPALSTSGLAG